jgi:hypothetical protein
MTENADGTHRFEPTGKTARAEAAKTIYEFLQ